MIKGKTKFRFSGFMLNEGSVPNITIWWWPFKDFFIYFRLRNYRWCWQYGKGILEKGKVFIEAQDMPALKCLYQGKKKV